MTIILWSLLFLGAIGFFSWQMWGRLRIILAARTDDGRDYSSKTWGPRIKNTLIYAFGQAKFWRDEQPAGILHIAVFWGFTVLSIQVITMFTRGWFPEFTVPGFGPNGLGYPYALLKDIFQTTVIVGVIVLLSRWLIFKPQRLYGFLPAEKRLRGQSHWEAIVILCFIATIMISGFLYDAGHLVLRGDEPGIADEAGWQPVTRLIASFFGGNADAARCASQIGWWVHNTVVLIFLNLLPRSKHFHIITAIPNVFFGKVEPRGRLPKRDFTVEAPNFGRSTINQFTQKQVLDMYSCTECGRCASVCPATATKKPLAPRQFLLDLRDNLYASQTTWIQKMAMGAAPEFDVIVGEGKAVSDETVWSCVQCRACEEACPVNIEYVDKMVDIRQHLVQEASRFPAELGRAFKGLETQSNPWGISADERDAWAEGFDVPRIMDKPDAEYLYYVGCGGSFDSNNRKVTQSFIKILKKAGVSFAILGKQELCNGETARRLGNEYLYQTMAEALVGVLNGYNVKKVLVNCPHCFNTLAKEYPEFGGNYEVIRAGDLVTRLMAEGKVPLQGNFDKKVVYHDSCNYGRFNGVYEEPRDLLKQVPGARMDEVAQSKEKGTCCGAGGGRMWMEEPKDQRVNIMRADQILSKKPDVIATSCPFCKIMLGSAINEKGEAEKVQVMDVMEVVAANLQSQT
jgi:Fe-S oxidoreductase